MHNCYKLVQNFFFFLIILYLRVTNFFSLTARLCIKLYCAPLCVDVSLFLISLSWSVDWFLKRYFPLWQEDADLAKGDDETYMEETAGLREGIMLIVGFSLSWHFLPTDCLYIHAVHSFASGSTVHWGLCVHFFFTATLLLIYWSVKMFDLV